MVSIVRFLIVVVVVCIAIDHTQAQEKVKSTKLEISSSLMDKGKRERLRQIYNRFWKETKIPFKCSYLVLNNLSRAGSSIETGEAFNCMSSYLAIIDHNQKVQIQFAREVEGEFGSVYREAVLQNNAYRYWTMAGEGCALTSIHP